ncbi:hypothetical protein GWK47_035883 [Chionoecetes opilio]|uniref:Uncharacterized protein n=1 Tax=Chionoecetes opilio TaxID=41210 RepID=A0A8J4YTL0_CHIOP|nr:hypothetical protein GWK47_035883 [Chionoecetes opilio]
MATGEVPNIVIPGDSSSSRGEVLQVFFVPPQDLREVLFAAAASTAEKVLEVWRRANIPTSDVSWVKKILKLYEEYGALAKSKSRKTETEEMKRCIFRDSLEDMFDIAHSKAMEAKIPEEDKRFLEAQREDRQSCSMAGVDEKLKRATEEKRRKRQRMEEMKKKDAAASSSTLDRDENKLTKELTLAWERDNLSIRAATSSYAAAAMSLGHDNEHVTVSRSSIHRARVMNREKIAMSLSFKPEVPLTRQGKLLRKRLEAVRESSLEGNIIGMAFDTTAANTGMVQGACIRIERALEKPLVWLACRHHILEAVLKDVFEACMGPSSGPNIALFKRLQNQQGRPQTLCLALSANVMMSDCTSVSDSESVAVTDLEYDAQSDTERNDAGRVYYEENEPQIVMGSYMFEPEYEVD